jgi:Lrp/AsnC family transcriptional regulator, leucine-responsive regulatory protein
LNPSAFAANSLDAVDRTLLRLLQANGRTPLAELGKAAGLSTSSVNDRVRRLHQRGVIEGVYAAVSPAALNLDLLAFVFLACNGPKAEERLLDFALAEASILECHRVTGASRSLLKVRAGTFRQLENLINALIRSVPGLHPMETIVVTPSAKETFNLRLPGRSVVGEARRFDAFAIG